MVVRSGLTMMATYDNGNVYDGQWKDDKMHGHGVYTTSDGVYDGQWKDGDQHGHGVYTCSDGRSFREKHLHGREIWSNYDGYI